jgi:hypothetical protein
MALACCSEEAHRWDWFGVESEWLPPQLRCFIVGENPGSFKTAYFYEAKRSVPVRTILLRELYRRRVITEPTLVAFRSAGFLFDHGIRCRLAKAEIKEERRLARQYKSPRATGASHLERFLRNAAAVWVMGYVARNAVSTPRSELPRDYRDISRAPYPGRCREAARFFVSRYLTRAPSEEVVTIFNEFEGFWNRTGDGSVPNFSFQQGALRSAGEHGAKVTPDGESEEANP